MQELISLNTNQHKVFLNKVQQNLTILNLVILNSLLFQSLELFSLKYTFQSFTIGYLELPLSRIFFVSLDGLRQGDSTVVAPSMYILELRELSSTSNSLTKWKHTQDAGLNQQNTTENAKIKYFLLHKVRIHRKEQNLSETHNQILTKQVL